MSLLLSWPPLKDASHEDEVETVPKDEAEVPLMRPRMAEIQAFQIMSSSQHPLQKEFSIMAKHSNTHCGAKLFAPECNLKAHKGYSIGPQNSESARTALIAGTSSFSCVGGKL